MSQDELKPCPMVAIGWCKGGPITEYEGDSRYPAFVRCDACRTMKYGNGEDLPSARKAWNARADDASRPTPTNAEEQEALCERLHNAAEYGSEVSWEDARDAATEIERLSAREEALFAAIQHGDDAHRAWLKEAIAAHFAGSAVPEPRGSGRKEAVISGLNAHLEAMQRMVSAYLSPGTYVAKNGMMAARDDAPMVDKLFIADMIYMLDGPEQRAVQSAASRFSEGDGG